jgi:predicted ATPase
MADPKKELQKLFSKKDRYKNFGPTIAHLKIQGFRGIEDLEINIESPITAISGLNGTGKSTVAQLCTCAYRKPITESDQYKRHIIANYFPVSKADPKPFKDDASIEYDYVTATEDKLQELTVYRKGSKWDGYKRQPERHCRYIGFTIYIPKVEQRDISIYRGNDITLLDENSLSNDANSAISKILNHPYENLSSATATHKDSKTSIGFATKFGEKYSENHMGFGEGRVFYTVSSLETAPEQSLFVLEEPETSLHEHAQYELAKYLIDVCMRRKHQIILTTHSRAILNALPRESRKLLYRDGKKVKVSNRTSTCEATGMLSLGYSSEKMVLVEDTRAKTLLTEIIRIAKPTLLKGVKVSFVGSDDVVRTLTAKFKEDGYSVVGVRDGDKGGDPKLSLYKLPGSLPPEKEVLQCSAVKTYIAEKYSCDLSQWLALNKDTDFHDWPTMLAGDLCKTEEGLWEELCFVYCKAWSIDDLQALVTNIEK